MGQTYFGTVIAANAKDTAEHAALVFYQCEPWTTEATSSAGCGEQQQVTGAYHFSEWFGKVEG